MEWNTDNDIGTNMNYYTNSDRDTWMEIDTDTDTRRIPNDSY